MDEKEVLNGYVIDVAMWIGHKRVCFGIAEDQKTEYPYIMCVYESEGYMFPVCDKLHCFDNYPEALHAFANKINECAKELEDRRAAIVGVDAPSCLTTEDVISVSWEDSIKGRVVAVKEQTMLHGFRDMLISFIMSTAALVLSRAAVVELVTVGIFTPERSAELSARMFWGLYPKKRFPNLPREHLRK